MAALAKLTALRARVAEDPWDAAAWEGLVKLSAEIGDVDKQREVFEDLLTQFPFAANYWQKYAELELDESETSRAKSVFSRCLLTCPSVKLWTLYLRFIKKMNETKGVDGLTELRKSYEYTLDRIGVDTAAGPVWQEYITFLQSPRVGTPPYHALFGGTHAGQEETQRTLLLRRAFHRALLVPGKHLDQLWRAYEDFEKSSTINPQLARRELDEQRPRYQAAKNATPEKHRLARHLDINALATPPGRSGWEQQEQMRMWKEYIAWEKSNPQMMEGPAVAQRVSLAFEQATMPLMQYPEIWYSHSRWHAKEGGGGPSAAASILSKAREALPDCAMLRFAAADLEESRGEIDNARAMYEELVAELPTTGENLAGVPNGDAVSSELSEETRQRGTLLWTQYLRFSRRVDGVAASRKIFLRARRWKGISWQIFVAAAKMEYASDGNDRVARNLFELGLEHFISIPSYVLQYVSFLEGLADIHNVRALFERALEETAPADAGPLWDRYIQFESAYSSLASVASVEQRQLESTAPTSEDIKWPLLQYRWLNLWPCSHQQQVHFKRLLGDEPAIQRPQPPGSDQAQPRVSATQDNARPGSVVKTEADGPGLSSVPVSRVSTTTVPPVNVSGPPEPLKQMPPQLGKFLGLLPSARGFEPPFASVEKVVDVLMKADLSPEAIAAAEEAALRASRRPSKFSQGPNDHQAGGGHPGNRQGWGGGVKRERPGGRDEPEAGEIQSATEAVDVFRARAKQRIRHG